MPKRRLLQTLNKRDGHPGLKERDQMPGKSAVAEVAAAARRLDDFILRTGMLPRDNAIRRPAFGHGPDPGMVAYLRELLHQTPVDQAYGVYVASDSKDWRDQTAGRRKLSAHAGFNERRLFQTRT